MGRRRSHELDGYVHGTGSAETLRGLAQGCATVVEARGTFCPEPVIRTQKAVAEMPDEAVAMILADDAGIEVDLPAWCISHRHEYLGVLREERFLRAFVRKKARR